MKKTAIIGTGIAGLSAAYSLEKKARDAGLDLKIDLFEKNGRTGGTILTETVNDFIIEGGPDCVFSEKPEALKLCRELNLEDRLLKTNEDKKGTFVFWKGKLHDLPEGVMLMVPTMIMPMLFSTLITLPGKLRMGFELFIPKKTSPTEETLAQFVTRRFGRELLDKIAEPLVAGIHAGDPETMSIKSSFPRFVDLEENYRSLIKGMIIRKKEMTAMMKGWEPRYTMFMTIKEGLQALPDALKDRLELTDLKLHTEVTGIDKKPEGFEIVTAGGSATVYDSVIIATPAHAASGITEGLSPALSEHLGRIPYVSTATVSLGYSKNQITHVPIGFGFIVPRISGRKIMAATFTSTKFSHRAPEGNELLRVFVGGASNEDLVFQDDEDMVTMVREELKDILNLHAVPLFSKVYRWEKAMPQYVVGYMEGLNRMEEILSGFPGLYLAGSAYNGIGISDCIVSADKAAEKTLKFLQQAED